MYCFVGGWSGKRLFFQLRRRSNFTNPKPVPSFAGRSVSFHRLEIGRLGFEICSGVEVSISRLLLYLFALSIQADLSSVSQPRRLRLRSSSFFIVGLLSTFCLVSREPRRIWVRRSPRRLGEYRSEGAWEVEGSSTEGEGERVVSSFRSTQLIYFSLSLLFFLSSSTSLDPSISPTPSKSSAFLIRASSPVPSKLSPCTPPSLPMLEHYLSHPLNPTQASIRTWLE